MIIYVPIRLFSIKETTTKTNVSAADTKIPKLTRLKIIQNHKLVIIKNDC